MWFAAPAVAAIAGAAVAATAAAAPAPRLGSRPLPPPQLRVRPAAGGPRSVFTVYFTAHQPTGNATGQSYSYAVTATAKHPARGCLTQVTLAPRVDTAGEAMAVALAPRRFGGRWCAGAYVGRVVETIRPACGPGILGTTEACPMYIALAPIGDFSFTVAR